MFSVLFRSCTKVKGSTSAGVVSPLIHIATANTTRATCQMAVRHSVFLALETVRRMIPYVANRKRNAIIHVVYSIGAILRVLFVVATTK